MQKVIILLFVLVILSGIAMGQVPQLINYQGLLIDPATGQAVPDGTYSITFSIYNVVSGGSAIWAETHSVETKDGLYSILLGSTTTLRPDILSGTEKYLGIKVGGDPEMTPRKRIVSVAYAITSSGVSGASNIFPSDGNVGIGTITPQKPLDVAASGGIRISLIDLASSNNEIFFQDNGQIRSSDENHRIIFDRSADILELREYGDIVFSPGALDGERTNKVTFKSSGNVGIGTASPSNETKLHIQAVSDDFGILVDGGGTSGSEIGLHSASSKYASLAKNAYFASGAWQRFDVSSGAYLQEVQPGGNVLFRTIGAGANPISWTNALTIKTDGTVKMAGFQLEASPTAGYVLTTDASGVGTWQPSGGFTLPYGGTVSSTGSVFYIKNTGSGDGIYGEALGSSANAIWGYATGTGGHAIHGEATGNVGRGGLFVAQGESGQGVHSEATGADGVAVYAISQYGKAVDALTTSASTDEWTPAIYGRNEGAGDGVYGWSQHHHGTVGVTSSDNTQHAGVYGLNHGAGPGVYGEATAIDGKGIYGKATTTGGIGVCGVTSSSEGAGVLAHNTGGGPALVAVGNVEINNQSGVTIMELGEGLDYAEGFDVSDEARVAPGTVLIIDPNSPSQLTVSRTPYDSKVAGIVAGAKGLGSGVRLGPGQFDYDVALAGRVYCNVDATEADVEPGDLLTTSGTPGYAMKATDYAQSQGAILGKAMERLEKGTKGQVLVLVTLQ